MSSEVEVRGASAGVSVRAAGVSGLVSVVFGLGVAHLVAAVAAPTASPIIAIANRFADATPTWLKDWAGSTFGTADKAVLVVGIIVVTTALGGVIGLLGRRRLAFGVAGGGALALIALVAAFLEPVRSGLWWLPAPVAFAAGSRGLRALLGRLRSAASAVTPERAGMDRRNALRMGAALGGSGVLAGVLGQATGSPGGAQSPSGSVPSLPTPASSAMPVGVTDVPGLSPFVTPQKDFYRIDTAFSIPRLDPATWRLTIDGMVDQEVSIGWNDLLAMESITRDVTLQCVSNEVAGELIGSARWLGVRTSELLKRAGIKAGADMVLSTSADGFTVSTPLQALQDDRDALIVYGMNGEALTPEHGFPVRLLTPGLYGFVGATKWLTQMTVTRYDAAQAYWTQRGWSEKGPIKPGSRIEVPKYAARVPAGPVKVGGAAWAPRVGVGGVQVRVDGGPWTDVELGPDAGIDYWRQWRWTWDATTPGARELQVRVIDRKGMVQTDHMSTPFPDGASGLHTLRVQVE